jgi:hypothetical protein
MMTKWWRKGRTIQWPLTPIVQPINYGVEAVTVECLAEKPLDGCADDEQNGADQTDRPYIIHHITECRKPCRERSVARADGNTCDEYEQDEPQNRPDQTGAAANARHSGAALGK